MTVANVGGSSMKGPSSKVSYTSSRKSSSNRQPAQTTFPTNTGNNNKSKNKSNNNNNNNNNNSKKNVDNTVFIRFVPPSNIIRRHHVEELFSQCGPIKKSSVIHTATNDGNDTPSSSYGFVKYTTREDAEVASKQLNNRTLTIDGISVSVKVELAKNQVTESTSATPTIHATGTSIKRIASNNSDSQNISKDTTEREQQRKGSTLDNAENIDRTKHLNQDDLTTHVTEKSITNTNDIKKTNRLIIRNLSFYAKESDIQNALQAFGKIVDIHIPKVMVTKQLQPGNVKGKVIPPTHRGFAFVTFEQEDDTEKCLLQSNNTIMIKERMVQISRSLHKTAYNMQQQEQLKTSDRHKAQTKKDNPDEDDHENEGVDDEKEEDDGDDDDDEDEDEDSSIEKDGKSKNAKDDTAIAEGRCLFVRNLPFDCTRHDIFDTFRTFGYVTSIFIVKTETSSNNSSTIKTLLPKGTAFVTFQKQDHAKKALDYANPTAAISDSTNFVSQRSATSAMMVSDSTSHPDTSFNGSNPGIVMKGRRLLVDAALDKETASTLIGGEKNADKIGYKDRRNLYLKNEGRVDNNEAKNIMTWDELPEGDKLKRQTAWSEKNTKLRSPLFYINPNRLSLRNLAKHIDEVALKKLIVTAIRRGLYENRLVQPDDQIAHWRASGEYTTREILAKIQEGDTTGSGIIPLFDEKNVKQSIPSLHIHRDVVSGGNKNIAPSRGFGFVEFQHHAHALACLRELNNNPSYSKEYAIGGKQVALMKERRKRNSTDKKRKTEPSVAEDGTNVNDDNYVTADGNIRTPRLIVEFTVENKAKAKQQAEQKAKQQANQIKQRMELKSDDVAVPAQEKARKSRGAIQREKKRQRLQQHEVGDDDPHGSDTPNVDDAVSKMNVIDSTVESNSAKKKARGAAPPKKQAKLDVEEATFSNLVASYQQQATSAVSTTDTGSSGDNPSKPKRRWYE